MSMRMFFVSCFPFTLPTSLTCRSRQSKLASGTGIATKSRRLMVTPGRFAGAVLPLRSSFQRFRPISQRASAWSADVFPELFGPMKTTGFPSSISSLPNFLKFLIVSFVSIRVLFHVSYLICTLLSSKFSTKRPAQEGGGEFVERVELLFQLLAGPLSRRHLLIKHSHDALLNLKRWDRNLFAQKLGASDFL